MRAADYLKSAGVDAGPLNALIASEQKVYAKRKHDLDVLKAEAADPSHPRTDEDVDQAAAGVAMEMDPAEMAEQLARSLSSNDYRAIAVSVLRDFVTGSQS